MQITVFHESNTFHRFCSLWPFLRLIGGSAWDQEEYCFFRRLFDFRLGRGRDGPKRFLGQFEGILQTDGYAAYDQIGGPRMVHAACWAHARRQFFEAVQLNPRDPVATPIVARMDELFAVDAEARRKALTTAARHIRRQETAKPLLDDIRSKIEAAQSIALPSSALSKACQYALTLWKKLTRFLEYPEFELSTNLAENSMRPVALGRKNWLHIGSPQAGPKVAAILSVVESCRRLKVSGARLLFRDSPRACRSPDPVPPRPYSRCVGRPAFIDSSNRGISAITRSLPFFRSWLLSPAPRASKPLMPFSSPRAWLHPESFGFET